MNNGAFGENFPYSNFHDLNMDWIIKIAKDFLDQYTHIQETIQTGLDDLDEKATTLEALLQEWYDTHSEDIANQLANALQDISNQLASAITTFNNRADEKAAEAIASIPDDYSKLVNNVATISKNIQTLEKSPKKGTADNNTIIFTTNYASEGETLYYDIDAYSGYTFFFEFYNANDEVLTRIGKLSSSAANHYEGYFTIPAGFSYCKAIAGNSQETYYGNINWLSKYPKNIMDKTPNVLKDEQSFTQTEQATFADKTNTINLFDYQAIEGYTDILQLGEIHTGYYYNADGTKEYNNNWTTWENIPYDQCYRYLFSIQPVIYAEDSSGEKAYYISQDSNNMRFTMPMRADIARFHMSTNHRINAYKTLWKDNAWKNKRCVIYGDSIALGSVTTSAQDVTPFTEIACKMNGIMTITNKAIGGASFSTGGTAAYNIWEDELENGAPHRNEGNLIIVSAGTNDWGHDVPIGTFGETDPATFYGAVYSILNNLKYYNNLGKVLCILPIPRGSGSAVSVNERVNGLGLTMNDYRDVLIKMCKVLEIPYVEPYELYIHPDYNPTLFASDKIHPNALGHTLMGFQLGNILANITPKTGESYSN